MTEAAQDSQATRWSLLARLSRPCQPIVGLVFEDVEVVQIFWTS